MAALTRRQRQTARQHRARKARAAQKIGTKIALGIASFAVAALGAVSPKRKPAPKRRPAVTKAPAPKAAVTRRTTPPSTFRAGIHHCEAGTRRYKIYRPGSAKVNDTPPALLVMLHGCGQTPDDFATGTGMNALAREHGFIVLYPAQSREAHSTRCWNWFQRPDQDTGGGEPAILASLTRQIIASQGIDPARVYVAGLSAGASMALVLARTYPDIFAAVGVHSGLPAGSAHDQVTAVMAMRRGNPGLRQDHPVPTIVFHGSRDSIVHPRNGRLVAIRAREAYPSLRGTETRGQVPGGHAYSRTVHRVGSGRPLVEHWTVKASGHAWSGGSPRGRFTDQQGPSASKEMVRFFLRHSLSARKRASLRQA